MFVCLNPVPFAVSHIIPMLLSAPLTVKSIPVAVLVPDVAPTTSISIPFKVDVPKLAEFTSTLIPISLCGLVPDPATVLSKSTCKADKF